MTQSIAFGFPVALDGWMDLTSAQAVAGVKAFSDACTHSGAETHSGVETHSGAETHSGEESFSTMFKIPTATVAAAGNAQGNAGALVAGFMLVTAADDTKGVVLPAAVAGRICIVKSTVSNKILKVYPASADAINAIAADSAISLASGPTVAIFVAYDATTWYTIPLLPS